MPDRREFLKDVYGLQTVAETRALYDDWAASYDTEITANGYATPARIAAALAARLPDRAAPVLDFGCGTGISGRALAAAGLATLDGCDLSEAMLDRARATGLYRRLWQTDGSLALRPGAYGAIAAVGVISTGAAPPEAMDGIVAGLAPGGLFGFSFNDHTFDDPRFEAKVASLIASGQCRQLLREAGPHLPGIGLGATIFVLERL
jgi:predicted TPR repeat methyltransferase